MTFFALVMKILWQILQKILVIFFTHIIWQKRLIYLSVFANKYIS